MIASFRCDQLAQTISGSAQSSYKVGLAHFLGCPDAASNHLFLPLRSVLAAGNASGFLFIPTHALGVKNSSP